MKSVLQQNWENYTDRWFRYVFCQCCMETYSRCFDRQEALSRTELSRDDRFRLIVETIHTFVTWSTLETYHGWFYVPEEIRMSCLEWVCRMRRLPAWVRSGSHFKCFFVVSAEDQLAVVKDARQELLHQYRFRANNVDRDFPDEVQAEAQEKLRQLLALPEGL